MTVKQRVCIAERSVKNCSLERFFKSKIEEDKGRDT